MSFEGIVHRRVVRGYAQWSDFWRSAPFLLAGFRSLLLPTMTTSVIKYVGVASDVAKDKCTVDDPPT